MIFVSHKESDANLAKALVDYLRGSLDIPDSKIRCTSVPGYQLPFGNTIARQLKADIDASHAIFALLTPASVKSSWVLFELGASWALGKVIVPILGPGISLNEVPGPVNEYPVVRVDDPNAAARLRDAINQVASELHLAERGGGRAQSELESFMRALRGWTATGSPSAVSPATPARHTELDRDGVIRQRMMEALQHPQNPQWKWRTLRQVAAAAVVSEEIAADLLRADPDVRFGKNDKTGEIIVGLRSRVD